MNREIVIGCEIHVQLQTRTKAFCGCENFFGGDPNSRVCPVCMGLPGAMPVLNKAMVESAVIAGLALSCDIASVTKFDRKNYVYPDLPKGYQISQFDMPICTNGHLDVETESGGSRRIGIRRLHMEEDAGKNIHPESDGRKSLVDFNRCGTPLLEIVTEPDMRSAEEAVVCVQSIREIMRFIGVSDCNMEEGSLRCDANINLWIDEDSTRYATPIVEIKNMNSFRSIERALEYEVRRQEREWVERRLTLEEVGKSTRGFDDTSGTTRLQRSKEEASDYRYFPEPDLPPVQLSGEYIAALRQRVGELPAEKRERYVRDFALTPLDAQALVTSREMCAYFEKAAEGYLHPRKLANWILSEVKKYLNSHSIEIDELRIGPDQLRLLLEEIDSGSISGKIAKDVFVQMADTGKDARTIISAEGLHQIEDESQLVQAVQKVLGEHPDIVADYRSGKQKVIGFLMGQVMKETGGKANPQVAMEKLRSLLAK